MEKIKISYNNSVYHFLSDYPDDHIFKMIKNKNIFYEIKLLEYIKSLKIKGTYVDVGANIGNHSIYFSSECKADLVISIEISDIIFKILEGNVKENNLDNIKIFNVGAGSKESLVTLSDLNTKNIGMTKIIDDNGDVKILPLDILLTDIENIGLIKIDVEGYELEVIKGSLNIINKFSPIIVAEMIDENVFKEFNEYMISLGYFTDKISYSATPTYIWKKNIK